MVTTRGAPSAESPQEAVDKAALTKRIARLENTSKRCSAWRLGSFVAFIAGLLGGLESPVVLLVVCAAALLAFAVAFVLHGRALEEKREAEDALTLLTEKESRASERGTHPPGAQRGPTQQGPRQPGPRQPGPRQPGWHRNLPSVGDTPTSLEQGRRVFAPEPASHPIDDWIADDLDVLRGPRSLFGLLDWTSTAFGARRLRYLLLHPLAHADDIRLRQDAIGELAASAPARNELLARFLPARRHSLEPLTRFFHENLSYANRRGLLLWCHLAGTLTPLFLLALILTGRVEWVAPLALALVLNFGVIGKHSRESNAARDRLLLLRPFLESCLRVQPTLDRLEAPAWKEIAGVLDGIEDDMRRLKRRLDLLAFHSYGVLFEIVNSLTLWELRLLPPAAALFARRRERLQNAAGALGEAEALLCLALRLAEDDAFILPTAVEVDDPILEVEGMGHPLLDPNALVANPLSLGREANVWILTGSNMSGKSTYLKSAGLNVLLAGAGGPVCAREFRWTPVALLCDINVRDSLDDGKSYFQVEVERVLNIVRSAEHSPKLLALFDELFRGTNSEERLSIARALLRHLGRHGVLVLAATHDRALADLVIVDKEPGMANYHLRETVENGVMRFDYLLREGVVTSRNAIRVLEAQGYPEQLVEEAYRSLPQAAREEESLRKPGSQEKKEGNDR